MCKDKKNEQGNGRRTQEWGGGQCSGGGGEIEINGGMMQEPTLRM